MTNRALSQSPVQRYLERLHAELRQIRGGELASYIPELTRANPDWLGIALVTVDGHVYQVGDSREPFTVQSISKAITYGLALEDRGLDTVLGKVGVEPSGEAFNSISLEQDTGRPLNPMINAGAIASTGLIADDAGSAPLDRILETFGRYTGHAMSVEEQVYRSESETGHRNRAIAHLLYGYGILERAPEAVLDLYFRQCSILVTARDLALMGACLANSGVNPVTGVIALQQRYVDKVLSVMSSCGMYDYSGAWVFNVGMPAKSGVGGGIMAVLPGQFGLGVFSPLLDPKGNSVRGIEACKRISNEFGLHLFNVAHATSSSVVRQCADGAHLHSRRYRAASERAALEIGGARIRIYELQGELLFGSTESITLRMLDALDEADYLIVSLKRVVGLDSASIALLGDMCTAAETGGKHVFFTDCGHLYALRRYLQKQLRSRQSPQWLEFAETDRALEWCEDALLPDTAAGEDAGDDLGRQYLCAGLSAAQIALIGEAGTERRFSAGETIVRTGEPADSLYFILDGRAESWPEPAAGSEPGAARRLRLTTLGPGMVFGEVGLLGGQRRSANVSAESDLRCLQLKFDAVDGDLRERMLVNMAAHFAEMLQERAALMQQLA
ncbi:MAG: glutaminase A [Thiohalocapsa sp.]|nr:glutaminase A [Thiohalocapsa sp.]